MGPNTTNNIIHRSASRDKHTGKKHKIRDKIAS